MPCGHVLPSDETERVCCLQDLIIFCYLHQHARAANRYEIHPVHSASIIHPYRAVSRNKVSRIIQHRQEIHQQVQITLSPIAAILMDTLYFSPPPCCRRIFA